MRFSTFSSRDYLMGILVLLIMGAVMWLLAGRLSLFQTSTYISLFGLDSAKEIFQEKILLLGDKRLVKQDFVSKYPGLYRISVLLRNPEATRDATVILHLKETCGSPFDLRQVTATIPKSKLSGEEFYPFNFLPVDESANQYFCFVLEQVIGSGEKSGLGVGASRVDVYSEGQAFFQASQQNGGPTEIMEGQVSDLPREALEHSVFLPITQVNYPAAAPISVDVGFQLHYSGRPTDVLSVFLNRLVAHKSHVWAKPGFYLCLLVGYLLALFLLFQVKPD